MKHTLSAADQWIALYGDYLYSLAVFKTNDELLSQDLVQETFLSALKARESFKGDSSAKTWFTTILNNKIIDHYRRKNLLQHTSDYLMETESSFHKAFFSEEADDWGHWKKETAPKAWSSHADARLNNNELRKIIDYCFKKLPSKLAPVFIARFVDEKEAEKICKELDISSSNYWTIIHRAKVLLRACLEKNWFAA